MLVKYHCEGKDSVEVGVRLAGPDETFTQMIQTHAPLHLFADIDEAAALEAEGAVGSTNAGMPVDDTTDENVFHAVSISQILKA